MSYLYRDHYVTYLLYIVFFVVLKENIIVAERETVARHPPVPILPSLGS